MTAIAVINSKGGAGKTTTAVYLAEILAADGANIDLLDADPQGSATEWHERATEIGEPLRSNLQVSNMRSLTNLDRSKSDHQIIDTPPGHAALIDAAIRAADLILIPTRPSAMDVSRVWETLRTTGDKPAAVLLTCVVYNTRSAVEAREVFDEEGIALFDTIIPQREAIKSSFGRAVTKKHGYDDVIDELRKQGELD